MSPLDQLRRIVALRAQYASELNAQGVRLLDRLILARFIDCRAAGLGREALRVLKGTR